MYGIREVVKHYKEALNLILDVATGTGAARALVCRPVSGHPTRLPRGAPRVGAPRADSDPEPDEWTGPYFSAAKDLYGLVHSRFIITDKGMQQMVCVGLRCPALLWPAGPHRPHIPRARRRVTILPHP